MRYFYVTYRSLSPVEVSGGSFAIRTDEEGEAFSIFDANRIALKLINERRAETDLLSLGEVQISFTEIIKKDYDLFLIEYGNGEEKLKA